MLAMTTVADPNEQLSPASATASEAQIELMEWYAAHDYHPLPVVVADAEGAWVTDVEGQALPRLPGRLLGAELRAPPPGAGGRAHEQLDRLTLTSRAFHNDQLGPFCAELGRPAAARRWCCR